MRRQLTLDANLQNRLVTNFSATNEADSGLLIRLSALNRLSDGSTATWTAVFVLFMLFTLIGLLPVVIGVLLPSKIYEAILRSAAERELREAVEYRLMASRKAHREQVVPPARRVDCAGHFMPALYLPRPRPCPVDEAARQVPDPLVGHEAVPALEFARMTGTEC